MSCWGHAFASFTAHETRGNTRPTCLPACLLCPKRTSIDPVDKLTSRSHMARNEEEHFFASRPQDKSCLETEQLMLFSPHWASNPLFSHQKTTKCHRSGGGVFVMINMLGFAFCWPGHRRARMRRRFVFFEFKLFFFSPLSPSSPLVPPPPPKKEERRRGASENAHYFHV